MHAVIINGSPRVTKYSNTDKIIDAFAAGMTAAGATFEKHAIASRSNWDNARSAYLGNTEIIIALPLFVENLPGILLEFLQTLPRKDADTRLSFIIQGGFAEAGQLRCGEAFVKTLPGQLGVRFGGTLVKGDNFGIRVVGPEDVRKLTSPYEEMGKAFVTENGFSPETARKFAGPDVFPLHTRLMLSFIFRTMARKRYSEVAKEQFGCDEPLDLKLWD